MQEIKLHVVDNVLHDVVHTSHKHVKNVKIKNKQTFSSKTAPQSLLVSSNTHLPCSNCSNATTTSTRDIPSADLALVDSGSSSELLLREESKNHLVNLKGRGGYCVEVANGSTICSHDQGDFKVADNCVITGHVFKDQLISNNLLGLAPFANKDYDIDLSKTHMSIAKNGVDIMHASKYAHENLWHINLSNLLEYDSLSRTHLDSYARTATRKQHITQQGYAHLAVHSTSAAEQVLWMSECMGSIPDVTIIRALRRGIFTFHGIILTQSSRPWAI